MNKVPYLVDLDSSNTLSQRTSQTLLRLGKGWLSFRAVTFDQRDSQSLAWLTGDESMLATGRPPFVDKNVPVLVVTSQLPSPFRVVRNSSIEQFNIAEPSERLCLLARFASECIGRESRSYQLTRATGVRQCIALIQHAFDLHLTVDALVRRVGIDATTLRRWYGREGAGTPEHQLIQSRVRALQEEISVSGDTLAECARRLRFVNTDSAGRLLRSHREQG